MAQKRQVDQQAETDPAIIAALAEAGLGPDGQPLEAEKVDEPAPVDEPIQEKPPFVGVVDLSGTDWRPMDDAPTDGTAIELTDNPTNAVGRVARQVVTRVMVGGRWTPTPRWVGPLSRKPIGFEPVGWRPLRFQVGS